jgi:hypothetical protein
MAYGIQQKCPSPRGDIAVDQSFATLEGAHSNRQFNVYQERCSVVKCVEKTLVERHHVNWLIREFNRGSHTERNPPRIRRDPLNARPPLQPRPKVPRNRRTKWPDWRMERSARDPPLFVPWTPRVQ